MEQEERRQEQEEGERASAASDAWAAWPLHDVPRIALDSENAATDFQYYLSWGLFGSWEENFPISDSHFSHTSTGKKGVLVFGLFFEVFSA